MAEVTLEGVSRVYNPGSHREVAALSDVSLTIGDGEFVVLLGPTGAGKTTTLRLVAGLEKPDRGRVLIGGREVTSVAPAARNVTFVFQQYSLYPHLSVFDNLAFPLRSPARRVPEPQIQEIVREVARLLRIEEKLGNKATQLSGGQMQRVAIGRALVRSPEIALMDEPLSSLDAKLRSDLRIELKRIQEQLGATILYVTHDQIEAMTLATRIGVLDRGRLVQVGTPREIYEQPVNAYVATRLGSPGINLLPLSLLPGVNAPAGAATLGARTEHVRIAKANGGAGGKPVGAVTWVEHLGDQDHLHIALGERDFVTLSDPDSGLERGDPVAIDFVDPLFFDAAGNRLRA
jgi:multiple sugar transport system ATP-binding protein